MFERTIYLFRINELWGLRSQNFLKRLYKKFCYLFILYFIFKFIYFVTYIQKFGRQFYLMSFANVNIINFTRT